MNQCGMLSDGQGELPSAQKIEFCCLNGTISQLTTLGAIGQRKEFAFRRVAHEQKIPLETRLRLTFADPCLGEWLTYASPESVVICWILCRYTSRVICSIYTHAVLVRVRSRRQSHVPSLHHVAPYAHFLVIAKAFLPPMLTLRVQNHSLVDCSGTIAVC